MDKDQLVDKLRQSLKAIKKLKYKINDLEKNNGPIAIIGMACKFPGKVNSTEDYWKLLMEGKDGIVDIPDNRWDVDAFYNEDPSKLGKMYVRKGGFINDIDQFDASFFSIAPIEAEAMDPQQRLLLQTAWKTIESGGIPTEKLRGSRTSVFVGIASPDYVMQRAGSKQYQLISNYDVTGNTCCTAAGRISYVFDLRGPNLALDTACSSSLVSIHLACKSLWEGESDMAMAGGVNLILEPNAHIIFSRMGALSPEGKCKTFSSDADGFVRSEGCGMVLLKRLKDAERDGDNILAVVKGTAINQDGKSNGLSAPNGLAQQEVIKMALSNAQMTAEDIDYIETHGTGTSLGDPIEIEAITNVYKEHKKEGKDLYIGSVKTNLGHLEAASGIASFIKVVLSLKHKCIPAHINFKAPSEHIAWKDFIKIPLEKKSFKDLEKPFAAGISAFGFSGTNAHLILEAYHPPQVTKEDQDTTKPHIALLSSKSSKGLQNIANEYQKFLKNKPDSLWSDFAYTTCVGRSHFSRRAAIVTATSASAIDQLNEIENNAKDTLAIVPQITDKKSKLISFLFTGQGSQYGGMGKKLYESEPVFKNVIDECIPFLDEAFGLSFLDLLFNEGENEDINQTQYTQPAIFVIEYALTKLWDHWNIKPDFLMGHSVGEYVAACYAAVFDLKDALKLIVARGKLMQALEVKGEMVAVIAEEKIVQEIINGYEKVSIAAINASNSIVISGDSDELARVMEKLKLQKIKMRRLTVSHAFHSPLMKPMLGEFRKVCNSISYAEPKIKMVSTVTGKLVTKEISNSEYWANHILNTVRFKDGLETLTENGCNIFLEVGADSILSGLVRKELGTKDILILPSQTKKGNKLETPRLALAHLFVEGFVINWDNLFIDTAAKKIDLPSYVFQTKRFWVDVPELIPVGNTKEGHPLLGLKRQMADDNNCYSWEQKFNLQSLPYLEDHKIEGAIVFPAACYTEMAVSAVFELTKSKNITLSNIKFEKVFLLKEGQTYELQMVVESKEDLLSFKIYSRTLEKKKEAKWVFRVSGQATASSIKPNTSVDLEEVKRRTTKHITGEEFYKEWHKAGNHWQESFKGVDGIWMGEAEIVSSSYTPSKIIDQLDGYYAHPALMDISGQLLAASLDGEKESAFVGKGVERIEFYDQLRGSRFHSYAQFYKKDKDSRQLLGDVQVFNEDGKLLATTTGLEFELIGQQAETKKVDEWLHEIDWVELDSSDNKLESDINSWLFYDPANHLSPETQATFKTIDREIVVCSEKKDLFENLKPQQKLIFIPEYESQKSSDALQKIVSPINEIETILRKLENQKLWVITQNVWDAEPKATLTHAPLWGLARTIEAEYEKLWGGIIDIDSADLGKVIIDDVFSTVELNPREKQVRIKDSTIKVARILKRYPEKLTSNIELKKEAAYLITGGLGDLGLLTANWLVEKGARRLLLTSRTGLPPRNEWKNIEPNSRLLNQVQTVKSLESKGAFVEVVCVDVANQKAFASWYDGYKEEEYPEIKGIVHAAGNVHYKLFGETKPNEITEQLGPKILGATILDHHFGSELDFFIMYSSASAVIPSPGLSIYAAANSFMDALAQKRNSLDQPALSINWGAWSDIGIVARQLKASGAERRDLNMINSSQGIELLDKIWNHSGQIAVLPIDWLKWGQLLPSTMTNPYYEQVIETTKKTIKGNSKWLNIIMQLKETPQKAIVETENYLKEKIGHLLRLEKEELAEDVSLTEYGLDSMMAIETRNKIEADLKVSLQMVDLINGPSIHELAIIIVDGLFDENALAIIEPKHVDYAVDQPIPLSQGQEALWTLHQLNPQSPAYNVNFSMRIDKSLDLEKWKQAFTIIVERHETLRTSIKNTGNEVSQFIRPLGDDRLYDFNLIDAAGWSNDQLLKEVKSQYEKPFDLENDPLLRVDMFQEKAGTYVFLLTIHHIACDGWSMWILLDEIKSIYTSLVQNETSVLSGAGFNYFDFVSWQNEMLESAHGEKLWGYWEKQLAGDLPVLNLPSTHQFENSNINIGATYRFDIDKDLLVKLKSFSQNESVTLYTTALALYKVLLYRYTGATDILVGSPTSGRSKMEFAEVVGDFINLMVIRTKPLGEFSFKEYLDQVKEMVLSALSNQDYPFPALVKKLNPIREAGRTPIFQTLFSLQKPQKFKEIISLLNGSEVEWGLLTLEPFNIPQQEGQFDLTLELIEKEEGMTGLFKYNANKFTESDVARFHTHFINLMDSLVGNPDQSISKVSLFTDESKEELLGKWIGNNLEIPNKCMHHFIEDKALELPDEIALVDGDIEMTYAELNIKSSQLAQYLVKSGVQKGELIGFCTERSVNMILTILAILKSGAAYVPLDPSFPAERLNYILNDSKVKHLIVSHNQANIFTDYAGQVINLSKVEAEIAKLEPLKDGARDGSSEDLAYVIYTSGSTGKPKGTLITHSNLVNFCKGMDTAIGGSPGTLLAVTTVSFDIAALELIWTLYNGFKVVLQSDNIQDMLMGSDQAPLTNGTNGLQKNRYSIVENIRKNKVTHLQCTPSLMQMLITDPTIKSELKTIRKIMLGGENLPMKLVKELHEATEAQLFNMYGPTETTIWSSVKKINREDSQMSIGQPIENTQLYILDAFLNPVSEGMVGELYIGGAGLSKGYLNRPDLTAQRFIKNPFLLGEYLIYKTGDLVKFNETGEIKYLERADLQVKINGHRIEVEEIESIINEIREVKESAVVNVVNKEKNILVAFVKLMQGKEVKSNIIKQTVRASLPAYMVPSFFQIVDEMPLTNNGKINRKQLTKMGRIDFFAPITGFLNVGASSQLEKDILKIWTEVLGVEKIGVTDNIFDLGGHSMAVTLIYNKLKEITDVPLSLVEMYEYPTVSSLAERLNAGKNVGEKLETNRVKDKAGVRRRTNRAALKRRSSRETKK